MKKLLYTFAIVAFLAIAQLSFAAQGTQQQNRVQDPTTHEETASPQANMLNTQTATQNQGEETRLRVSTQVQEMLNVRTGGGIGEQIRVIAQEQTQAQTRIEEHVGLIDAKGKLARFLSGPDYSAISSLEEEITQNKLRIENLDELKNQLYNQSDISMVEETIQALIEQNTALEEKIALEEKPFSFFGWLFKLING